MGREKVIARKKGNHTAENMLKAIKLHRTGVSIRSVAKQLNIAYPTLRRYVVKYLNVPIADLMDKRLTPNYENRVIFTPPQEEELKAYIVDCALRFYGLTVKDCRKVAYQMAKINKIEVPEGWEKEQMAGKEWFRSFKKRHSELTVKKPEACSLARVTAFNRETVKTFFDNLKTAIERHPSFGNGCRIYNLDETSTTTVQKPSKLVALKGKHNLSKVTSGEKGTLVTTCAIVSATGQYLPPAMVFPRKNFKDFMLKGAPPGTLGLAQKSGWMTSDLFVEVMKHFIKYTNASPENPALLILDNHESHLSIEALDLAKSSGVTVLTLHPHTTSKLQPLDVGLNGPFKIFYNNAVDHWLLNHPGTPMTIYNVAECVGAAYPLAMSPVNIAAAFKKCGIFPYNPNIFTDIDFLPADVTDRALPPELDMQSHNAEAAKTDSDNTDCEDLEMAPSPTILEPSTENPDENQLLDTPVDSTAQPSSPAVQKPLVKTGKDGGIIDPISPIITTSAEKKFISPIQFMPPLKAGPRTNARKNRKKGKSRIATDTPEKIEIANDRQKARDKKAKVEEVKRSVFTSDKKNEPIKKKPAKRAIAKTGAAVKNVTKKKKLKREVSPASSSEEDIEEIELLSETDISECQDSEDEDMFPIISGNFPKLPRKPVVDDYVLVAFDTKKNKVFYVAQIIEESGANAFGASFMRIKNKAQMKFIMLLEPDMAEVNLKDIKLVLPPPKINGTKNRNSTYCFAVRVAPTINIR